MLNLDFNNTKMISDFLSTSSVIEASAGTGKTYTITKLIRHCIINNLAKPEEILVVTYTEKASGELKARISAELVSSAEDQSLTNIERERLNNAAHEIDKFSISTIHSFCNALLSEYSFETGEQFQSQMVDDDILIDDLYLSYMRKNIFDVYKAETKTLLEMSSFYTNPEAFGSKIKNLAKIIYPLNLEGIDYLKIEGYDPAFNLAFNIEELIKKSNDESICEPAHSYDEIWLPSCGVRTTTKEKFNALLDDFRKIASSDDKNIDKMIKITRKSKEIDETFKNYINKLNEGPVKQVVLLLIEIIDLKNNISLQFNIQLAYSLVNEIKLFKHNTGGISFNDMLTSVADALIKNKNFVSLLNNRFKFGFVDEFQDTDIIQWHIFKSIFKENSSLVLIGDPKQAIYSFRSADVYTYIAARDEIKLNGKYAELTTNYRSTPKIIDGYNKIFSENNYFKNENMKYENVSAPKSNPSLTDDKCEGLYFVSLKSYKPTAIAKYRRNFVIFMVEEIKQIINGKYKITRKNNQNTENLLPGDICILVSARNDAKYIENVFKEYGIESTFYKKASLYQSEEAVQLGFILDAICSPSDKSKLHTFLLSEFMDANIKELITQDNDELYEKSLDFLSELSELAFSKKWSQFFNQILNKTKLFFRAIQNSPESSERKITNYQQITENLEKYGFTNRSDIHSLKDYLNSLIQKEISSEGETDLHRLETEKSKVQIMTIHASKGLEFPIVFHFAALKGLNPLSDHFTFHKDNKIVIDINKTDENKKAHINEKEEELRRLHYVAMTRPILALYIPTILAFEEAKKTDSNSHIKDGITYSRKSHKTAGELFISNEYYENSEIKKEFKKNEILISVDDNNKLSKEKIQPNYKQILEYQTESLHYETNENLKRFITIQSFTSLNRLENLNSYEVKKRTIDELHIPIPDKVDELPSGSSTGTMLHYLIENLDPLGDISSDTSLIVKTVTNYFGHLPNDTITRYCELTAFCLKRLFNTKLEEAKIKIGDIPAKDKIMETEFYLKLSENYINGIIDMVFRSNNKYYIVDWKSNKLTNYSCESFRTSVEKHYLMQSEIYHLAVVRYLESVIGSGFDYSRDFGGIYYIYLRGLKENKQEGIYFSPPDYEKYLTLQNQFDKKLSSITGGTLNA